MFSCFTCTKYGIIITLIVTLNKGKHMFMVLEVDNSTMIVIRQFPLLTEDSVERFSAQTNIQLNKDLLNDNRFSEHLFTQLETNADENVSYMIVPVTLH